jgi:hypothetical protein
MFGARVGGSFYILAGASAASAHTVTMTGKPCPARRTGPAQSEGDSRYGQDPGGYYGPPLAGRGGITFRASFCASGCPRPGRRRFRVRGRETMHRQARCSVALESFRDPALRMAGCDEETAPASRMQGCRKACQCLAATREYTGTVNEPLGLHRRHRHRTGHRMHRRTPAGGTSGRPYHRETGIIFWEAVDLVRAATRAAHLLPGFPRCRRARESSRKHSG